MNGSEKNCDPHWMPLQQVLTRLGALESLVFPSTTASNSTHTHTHTLTHIEKLSNGALLRGAVPPLSLLFSLLCLVLPLQWGGFAHFSLYTHTHIQYIYSVCV